MWTSAKQLSVGIVKNWAQLAGGTVVAVLGLLADAKGLAVPRWVWAGLALTFVGWAVLAAYHALRMQCDAAIDGLRDKANHQAIADFLTDRHQYGIHELLHKPPLSAEALAEWNQKVQTFNEQIFTRLVELGCTPQDMNHVRTVAANDLPIVSGAPIEVCLKMHFVRLNRIADVSTKYAKKAEETSCRAALAV